jgi:ribonuclease HI
MYVYVYVYIYIYMYVYIYMGRGEEGNSSNRAELGAERLALEDAKGKQDRKPVILLSDSGCFLSSSQKWIGEGKSPSMWGNLDADIMRDIVQLLRERIEQGLLTVFIKIKAHRGDPPNELSDRWETKGDRVKISDGPFPQTDLSSPGLNSGQHTEEPNDPKKN